MKRTFLLISLAVVSAWGRTTDAVGDETPPLPTDRPNIVLIAIDTVRADHLGCYGYERPTSPNIDRFAEQGVLFERCYSPASWTLPSFMTMFTGVLPAVHGCTHFSAALSSAIPTLPQRLKEQGYFCGAVVSNPFLNAKYGFGWGFDLYDDYSVFLDAELALLAIDDDQDRGKVNETVTGATVTQQAIALIDKAAASQQPFFLFIHYFDPHDSYIPPAPYARKFDPDYKGPMDGRNIPPMRHRPPNERDLQHIIARYDGEIAYDDSLFGKLLRKLDETAAPERTLTILLSDHGEAFGEHGMLLHGNSAYREEVWVPMIWRWPGVLPAGRRIGTSVGVTDLPATIRDWLSLERLDHMQGESLAPLMTQPDGRADSPPVWSQAALGKMTPDKMLHIALTDGDRRLHARFPAAGPQQSQTQWEAYDLASDPWEGQNLYDQQSSRFADLQQLLIEQWNSCQELKTRFERDHQPAAVELTEKERRRIEGLGYTGVDGGH